MKKYSFILLTNVLFTFVACNDFLTEDPRSAIGGNSFYKNSTDAIYGVNGVYSSFKNYFSGLLPVEFGDISTEIANNGEGSGGIDMGDYTAVGTSFRSLWSTMYSTINRANVAIQNIPPIDMDETLKNRLVAECRFIRAYCYFELVRAFAGVPLITTPTVDDTNGTLPRVSTENIYAFVISELEEVEKRLPATYSASDIGRTTSGAAKALLAKVHLQKGDFVKAKDKASEVMEMSSVYGLVSDIKDLYSVEKKNSKEHIFSIQYKSGDIRNAGSNFTAYFASRNPNILAQNNYIAGAGCAAEKLWYESIPEHYRKRVMLLSSVPSPYYPKIVVSGNIQAGPCCMKYWDDDYGKLVGGSDVNFPVLRYADIVLVFAECENELNGPTPAAYDAINSIRKRARTEAGVEHIDELPDLVGLSKEAFREAVYAERGYELCFEGHHRWDLLRTNTFMEVLKKSGKDPQEKHKLFPIPFLEIQANPNLTQNPGY